MPTVRQLLGALVLIIGLSQPLRALGTDRPTSQPTEPLQSKNAAQSVIFETLTSATWQPVVAPLELHWELLRLPERVFRLALSPLYPLVDAFERYRLDQRLYDLVTNDDRTIMVLPLMFLLGSDGFGAGLRYSHSKLFGREDRKLTVSAALYTNVDVTLAGHYEQTIATLNGRAVALDASYEDDENVRYYGIGGNSTTEDERGLRRQLVEASATVDILGPQFTYLRSNLALIYRHEKLLGGSRPGVPSLGTAEGDGALLPPGFGRGLDYFAGRLSFAIDRRQPTGRTTGGWIAQIDFGLQHDLNSSAELSAVNLALSGSIYALVLPRYRVLVLSAGGAAAFPWGSEETVPLQGYISLGRKSHLRGFARDRFIDRYAWWVSLEYRYPIMDYPISEYMRDDLTVSFTLFADLARAGDDVSSLFGEPPRWSGGFGLHFASATWAFLQLQLGFSTEGVEVTFGLGM